MATVTRQRSVQVEAPVKTVFDHVEGPHQLFARDVHDGRQRAGPAGFRAVDLLAWNGDRDIDAVLAFYEREIPT